MFKALDQVEPLPNYNRKPTLIGMLTLMSLIQTRWQWSSHRAAFFSVPLTGRDDDGLRGFMVQDIDNYGLFLAVIEHKPRRAHSSRASCYKGQWFTCGSIAN